VSDEGVGCVGIELGLDGRGLGSTEGVVLGGRGSTGLLAGGESTGVSIAAGG